MAWPAVAAAVAGAVARKVGVQILKRPIISALGVLIGYEIVTDDGEVLGIVDEDDIQAFENAVEQTGITIIQAAGSVAVGIATGLAEAGEDIAEALGTAFLQSVRGFGPAIIQGIDSAYDSVRSKLRGHEPEVVAAITIGFGVVFGVVYLYNSFKNANDAFKFSGEVIQLN
jgi:sporulation protein YlmC with PRC-barrel domain